MIKENNLSDLMIDLVKLYQQQSRTLHQIVELNQQLSQLLVEEEAIKIEELLINRADYLEQVEKTSLKIKDNLKQLSQQLDLEFDEVFITKLFELDLPYIEQLKEEVKVVFRLIQKIKNFNQEFIGDLKEEALDLRNQLVKVKQGSNLNRSYQAQHSYYEGKFIDQKK
ncbi:MAG: hypothetical protein ACQEQI_05615 [Bacillota bacterium]